MHGPRYSPPGNAYIYERTEGTTLELVADLKSLIQNEGITIPQSSRFGHQVSTHENIAAVSMTMGPQPSVFIFEKISNRWTFKTQIKGNNYNGINRLSFFGDSLDLTSDTLAVGAPSAFDNNRGAVFIFAFKDGTWKFSTSFDLEQEHQRLGSTVKFSPDGQALFVSAPNWRLDSLNPYYPTLGRVLILKKSKNKRVESWDVDQVLKPWDGQLNSEFGRSMAVYDNYLFVGAPRGGGGYFQDSVIYNRSYRERNNISLPLHYLENAANGNGAIYIYKYNGESWESYQDLRPPQLPNIDFSYFGRSIALLERHLLVGDPDATVRYSNGRLSRSGVALFYHAKQGDGGQLHWSDTPRMIAQPEAVHMESEWARQVTMQSGVIIISHPYHNNSRGRLVTVRCNF
jgi:hypothetical protein